MILAVLGVLLMGCQQNTPAKGTTPPPAKALLSDAEPGTNAQTPPTPVTPTPTPQSEQDGKIVMEIRDQLKQDSSISTDLSKIQISSNNGIVTINGEVKSATDKAAIAMRSGSVNGVRGVENNLCVTG